MKTLKLTLTTAAGCTGIRDITCGLHIVWDRIPTDDDQPTLARFDLTQGDQVVETFELDGAAWLVLEAEADLDELARDACSCDVEGALRAQLDDLENHYAHQKCGTKWTDRWSCGCDDQCPSCGADIEAHDSIMLSGLSDDQPAKYVASTA